MKTLTLEETVAWMDRVILEGTDYGEDFWSNFCDASFYLKTYQGLLQKSEMDKLLDVFRKFKIEDV